MLGVPMLRQGEPLGVIVVGWAEAGPVPKAQEELLKQFADQAVIAIENVRLFDEVQARTAQLARSVSELEALGEVGRAIASTLDLRVVLDSILAHACQLADSGGGAIYVYDPVRRQFDLEAGHNMGQDLIAAMREHPIRPGDTLIGQCAERREAVQIADLTKAPRHPLFDVHLKAGVRALLAVPLLLRTRWSARSSCGASALAPLPTRRSDCCNPSRRSRRSPSRTRACSRSSSRRAASWRRRAGTSPSSSPT